MSNNITKKTDRKNKTNQVIKWPSADSFFTVKTLHADNSDFKEITLRVRLKNALEEGLISDLGTINGGKGRPTIAFAMNPVSPKALEAAKTAEVLLHERYTVNVVNIKSDSTPTNSTVKTPTVTQSETVNA
jgi:hypothetical protein